MKKIILILFIFLFSLLKTYALEEIQEEITLDNNEHPVVYEEPIELETPKYSLEALKGVIEKDYDLKSTKGIFSDKLRFTFESGPVKEVQTGFNMLGNLTQTIGDESNFKYNQQILNVPLRGKLRSEKEKFNFLFDLSPNHQNFFHRLVLDAWVETNRIPHHTVMFGTSRPQVGVEGGQSPYTLPFLARSQTARNFGNIRKTGLRIKGDYKYVDYDIGGYSSDTWYSEFFPGVETDLWVNLKPLANVSNKTGNLNIGGGIVAGGRNSHDFFVTSAALSYDYKKFWLRAEFQNADGSNGASGITEKKRWGYNLTLAYRLTKKLEALIRYDDFDPDKSISDNNKKEYTLGVNYYILGQSLRLVFNYIFCQNQNASDSHKIILGTQVLL